VLNAVQDGVGDHSMIELAVAGNAVAIVSHNVRDLARGGLVW